MGNDYEILIENIIAEYQKANGSLWQVAEGVYSLYQLHARYERDFSATLSQELAVGVDTILHWRKAWDLRARIAEAFPVFVWDGLSISHAYGAADYVERMGIDWVTEWLTVARDSHWSSRRLAAEMCAASNDSGTLPWLISRIGLSQARLVRLYQDAELSGLSELDRRRLRVAIKLLERITQTKTAPA